MLTVEQVKARIEAYQEVIDHLQNHGWTDDGIELHQGDIIAKRLEKDMINLTIKYHVLLKEDEQPMSFKEWAKGINTNSPAYKVFKD